MSSDERLDVLRERNKDLLIQLRQQQEKLGRLCGSSQSRKREREDDDDEEEGRQSAEMRTFTDGDRGPARAALCKIKVKFAGNPTVYIVHTKKLHLKFWLLPKLAN